MVARIDSLPIDIWNNIPLNYQLLTRLERTSQYFTFFEKQKKNSLKQAFTLLHLIFHDKVAPAKVLLKESPESLFTSITFMTPENTIATINPWQYALKLANKNMVEIFISHLVERPATFKPDLSNESYEKPATITLESYSQAVDLYTGTVSIYKNTSVRTKLIVTG